MIKVITMVQKSTQIAHLSPVTGLNLCDTCRNEERYGGGIIVSINRKRAGLSFVLKKLSGINEMLTSSSDLEGNESEMSSDLSENEEVFKESSESSFVISRNS